MCERLITQLRAVSNCKCTLSNIQLIIKSLNRQCILDVPDIYNSVLGLVAIGHLLLSDSNRWSRHLECHSLRVDVNVKISNADFMRANCLYTAR